MDNSTDYMFPPTETIESVKADRDRILQRLREVTVERDRLRAELGALKKNFSIDACDKAFCEDAACPAHHPHA